MEKPWKTDWCKYFKGVPMLRSIGTFPERRDNAAPEVKQYVRGKRRGSHLPNAWDDITPTYDKSWKARTKVDKQYKRNLKQRDSFSISLDNINLTNQ